jgi:uncharacterized sporulation protein YeaH/YhbH (DUF444 family)
MRDACSTRTTKGRQSVDDVETIEGAILAQLREEYTDSPHGLALLSEHHTEETVRDILRSKIRELAAKEAKTRGLDPDSDEMVMLSRQTPQEALAKTDINELIADVMRDVKTIANLPRSDEA